MDWNGLWVVKFQNCFQQPCPLFEITIIITKLNLFNSQLLVNQIELQFKLQLHDKEKLNMPSMFCYETFLSDYLIPIIHILLQKKNGTKIFSSETWAEITSFWSTFKIVYETPFSIYPFRVATFSIELSQIENNVTDCKLHLTSSLL